MKSLKCFLSLAAIFMIVFVSQVQAQELRIGTASQGGAFYPVGQAIATLINKYADGLTAVPVVTQGSVQNPRLVNSGEIDIGIFNGAIRTNEHRQDALLMRDRCRVLIAFGACAA